MLLCYRSEELLLQHAEMGQRDAPAVDEVHGNHFALGQVAVCRMQWCESQYRPPPSIHRVRQAGHLHGHRSRTARTEVVCQRSHHAVSAHDPATQLFDEGPLFIGQGLVGSERQPVRVAKVPGRPVLPGDQLIQQFPRFVRSCAFTIQQEADGSQSGQAAPFERDVVLFLLPGQDGQVEGEGFQSLLAKDVRQPFVLPPQELGQVCCRLPTASQLLRQRALLPAVPVMLAQRRSAGRRFESQHHVHHAHVDSHPKGFPP